MSATDKPQVEWRRNVFKFPMSAAGWHLLLNGEHVGTVYSDGDWYAECSTEMDYERAGSQPLAAQALLRAVGVSQ